MVKRNDVRGEKREEKRKKKAESYWREKRCLGKRCKADSILCSGGGNIRLLCRRPLALLYLFFLSLHPYPVPSHLQSKKKTLLLLLLLLLSFLSPSFLPFSRATPTTTNRGLLPHFFPSPLQLLRFFFPRFLASLLPSLRLSVATITAQLPLPWQG